MVVWESNLGVRLQGRVTCSHMEPCALSDLPQTLVACSFLGLLSPSTHRKPCLGDFGFSRSSFSYSLDSDRSYVVTDALLVLSLVPLLLPVHLILLLYC